MIEIKGAGEHGILFVSPSPHKNGHRYAILGVDVPEAGDSLYQHLQNILIKYGIEYPSSNNGNGPIDNGKILIQELFKPGTQIVEGNNRHEALLRIMESLMLRTQTILEDYQIREFAENWNINHCSPPLNKREVQKQWNDAKDYVKKINKHRAFERSQYQERQKREEAELELFESEQFKNEAKNPLSISKLARLNEEGKMHYGAGQITSLDKLYIRIRAVEVKCLNVCFQ